MEKTFIYCILIHLVAVDVSDEHVEDYKSCVFNLHNLYLTREITSSSINISSIS